MSISDKLKEIIKCTKTLIIENRISIICLIVFLFFYPFFILLWTKYIVTKFLIYSIQSYLNDFVFFSLTILFSIIIYQKIKKRFYIFSHQLFLPILLSVFYLVIRWKFHNEFLSLKSLSFLKYSDILFLVFISPIIIKIIVRSKNTITEKEEEFLYPDEPIESFERDIRGWKNKINLVFKNINSFQGKSSIALGIVGKWGAGKTSFMNLLYNKFKNEEAKYIPIKFSTWLGISPESIIQDFFNTVEKQIKPESIDFSNELRKYGELVLRLHDQNLGKQVIDLFKINGNSSLNESFKKLNKQILKLNKKIIIFLDDLDRLEPKEVFQVLRLIRNTASFRSFVYIVGYDKEYLVQSLEKIDIPIASNYCEKIFLKEYLIFPLSIEEKSKIIKDSLLDSLPQNGEEVRHFFETLKATYLISLPLVFSSLKDIRDITRFLNEFKGGYSQIVNEVDFYNYFLIKLLKLKFYKVYLLLFLEINKFTSIDNAEGNIVYPIV